MLVLLCFIRIIVRFPIFYLHHMSFFYYVLLESVYGSYYYNASICYTNDPTYYSLLINNTSLANCKLLCYGYLIDNCNGIFWNRLAGQCVITSFTGDSSGGGCHNQPDSWMYLRLMRKPCQSIILPSCCMIDI